MITERARRALFLLVFVILVAAACREEATTTPVAVAPTTTPGATASPAPTATHTPVPPTATGTAVATATVTATPELTSVPNFTFDDCRFDVATVQQPVDCGWLEVPEDWSDPDPARTIRLHVAIFRSDNEDAAPDPIVYLEGGPGGDALETVPYVFTRRFAPFLEGRDFIMFDQRGTGYSEPSLACPEYEELSLELLDDILTPEEEAEVFLETLESCHDRLAAEGVNFAAYNSDNSAADVDALREALGYETWNLLGISYGTRLAQTVMREHPEGVRSVILDSVYPISANLVTETPANMARAFDVFFAGCAADATCADAYPELETRFYELVPALNAAPLQFDVFYVFTGDRYEAVLLGDDLIGLLFQGLYSAEIIPTLPQMIAEVEAGETQLLSTLVTTFLANNEFMSIGMQYSVQCQEEVAFTSPAEVTDVADDYPELAEFFASSPNLGETAFAACDLWGAGAAAPVENEAVSSEIPALILAGEYDPITPPAWGELVASTLPNSYGYEFPGIGHGVSLSGDCPFQVTQAFLDAPTRAPDVSCIDTLTGPTFAVPGDVAEIELVPFTSDLQVVEISGLVPDGWEEVVAGTFARQATGLDQTVILQQAAPAIPSETLIQLLAGQLNLEGVPEQVDSLDVGGRSWALYEAEAQGAAVDIGLAEADGFTYIVMLLSNPGERDSLYEAVFLPALEAIEAE